MNLQLTEQIVRHIYYSFGIQLPNKKSTIASIMSPEFLLSKKVKFDDGVENNIWGITIKINEENTMQILLADCSQEIPEFAMLVSLDNMPTYGCYLDYTEYGKEDLNPRPIISCNITGGSTWGECNVLLQSSFLSGLERIRELSFNYAKAINPKYDLLFSFISHYQTILEGESNEG